jgi:pyruvate,water dikinase
MNKGNISANFKDRKTGISGEASGTPLQSSAEVFTISKRLEGTPISPGINIGRVKIVTSADDLDGVENGAVLVCKGATRELMAVMPQLRGFITESGGMLSFGFRAAIASGVPAVRGGKGVLDAFQNGDIVRIDGFNGDIQVFRKGE